MNKGVFVREALPNDCREIWEWWNDPVTREMMKKTNPVPWEVHCKWFDAVLDDDKRLLIMGLFDEMKIGNTRFDYQVEGIYEVSINVNPDVRGRGIGSKFLAESIQLARSLKPIKKVFATLKKRNVASKRAFEKTGFCFIAPVQTDYAGLQEYIVKEEYYCEICFD